MSFKQARNIGVRNNLCPRSLSSGFAPFSSIRYFTISTLLRVHARWSADSPALVCWLTSTSTSSTKNLIISRFFANSTAASSKKLFWYYYNFENLYLSTSELLEFHRGCFLKFSKLPSTIASYACFLYYLSKGSSAL